MAAGEAEAGAGGDQPAEEYPAATHRDGEKTGDEVKIRFVSGVQITGRKIAEGSRPRGFHPESLAEPHVTLSRHTAPIIQPYFRRSPNERTSVGKHPSSGRAIPCFPAYAYAGFCISVWPIAQLSGRYIP